MALTSIMRLLYMKQKETGELPSEKGGLNFLALVFIIYISIYLLIRPGETLSWSPFFNRKCSVLSMNA